VVTNELVLAEVVRAWVEQELPGHPGAAEGAAGVGRRAYEQGMSVSEACAEATAFVGSWARHPAHQTVHRQAAVVLAS